MIDATLKTKSEAGVRDTGFGVLDRPGAQPAFGGTLEFTHYRPAARKWEGQNFQGRVQ